MLTGNVALPPELPGNAVRPPVVVIFEAVTCRPAERGLLMKLAIHPAYHSTLVRCSNCGAEHDLRSTRERLSVDICSSCHPFSTGSEQRISRGGQIARFEARRRLAAAGA
jgi:large subunit ribosomal protein L31